MSESFIKTEKIAIDHLLVEITRKCQLRCAHCLRGDAQNINMVLCQDLVQVKMRNFSPF